MTKPALNAVISRIDNRIKTASTNMLKVNDYIHETCVMIVEHANGEGQGDCTRAVRQVRALPAKLRSQMIAWFSTYSPIGISLGKTAIDDKCRFIKPESKNFNSFNIEGARANKWFDHNDGRIPDDVPLDTLADLFTGFDGLLEKWLKKAEKDDKVAADDRDIVKSTCVDIKKLLTGYRSKQLAAIGASVPGFATDAPDIPVAQAA
jgi:hypothetical protein